MTNVPTGAGDRYYVFLFSRAGKGPGDLRRQPRSRVMGRGQGAALGGRRRSCDMVCDDRPATALTAADYSQSSSYLTRR